MELIFSTKEENNKRREKAFLALSPVKRLESFLRMVSEFHILPKNDREIHKNDGKGNFVLTYDAGKSI